MSFGFGRIEGLPTQYSPNATPVTVDVLDAGFITAYIIILSSFLISLPKTNFLNTLYAVTTVSVSLTIGLFLLLENFGQEWEVGRVRSRMPYVAGKPHEINASVALKIGLRSVNVTLYSVPEPGSPLEKEIINYNERFRWSWDQGRFGFGPYAGQLQQEFRVAQYRGLPTPILWVVDYFVIDGEGFRFGRFYRTAGWYSHILLWCAFTTWLLANILFRSVISYGAYLLGITGILQLCANLIWLVVRNSNPLVIPFEEDAITTKFGFSYWLTLVTGCICVLLSIGLMVMDHFFNVPLHQLFGVDPLNSYDDAYFTNEEVLVLRNKNHQKKNDDIPLVTVTSGSQLGRSDTIQTKQVLIRRSMLESKLRKVRSSTDDPIYGNADIVNMYHA